MILRPFMGGWLCGSLLGVVACSSDSSAPHGPLTPIEPIAPEMSGDTPEPDAPGAESPGAEAPGEDPLPAVDDDPAVLDGPLQRAFLPLLEDALTQPEEARPYLRYVLASRGAAAPDSEQERLALLRLVNSVSTSQQLVAPVYLARLDAYRLDLRDYLWNRPVDVSGVTVADGWEAIVDGTGLGLPQLADEPLAALTGTATPALPARALLVAAASGSVYYALTSAPGFEEELHEKLGARYPDPDVELVYSPAFGATSRHDYDGARRSFLPDGKAYWQGLVHAARDASLYEDPFGFTSWETHAIYPLPNGLPAFFLDTPAGQATPSPLTQLAPRSEGLPDQLVTDCIACHSTGPLPARDMLVDFVRNNPELYGQDAQYVVTHLSSQEQLDAIVAADSDAYARVLASAGLSSDSAAALQTITRNHAAGLSRADMAAALHASEAQLRSVLPPDTVTLDAQSFRAQFRGLLCQTHPEAREAAGYCP